MREALGPAPRLRLDANGSWTIPQALRNLRALAEHDIDFVEQPVRDHPIGQLAEVRTRSGACVCANEGLWSEADAYARIRAREADVYCFSPYWVGSIAGFHRLAWVAHHEGLQVCKHTHGELGLAAAAAHHVVLTIPNGVEGHQQTAYMMEHDILHEPLPIASGPRWGAIEGPASASRSMMMPSRRRRRGTGATASTCRGRTISSQRRSGERPVGGKGRARRRRRFRHGAGRRGRDGGRGRGGRRLRHRGRPRRGRRRGDRGGGGTAPRCTSTSRRPSSSSGVVAETVDRFGRLDVLYHCAADVQFVNTSDRRLTELEDDVWQRMIDIHLTGTFLVLKHVGPADVAQGSGSIIVSSTVDALVGCAGLDSYTAAKGGVTSLVRSFAAGVGRDGVRVNAIAPSFVSTEPQRVWLDDAAATATIESLHILPIPTPEQIAPFVVYLASDESAR